VVDEVADVNRLARFPPAHEGTLDAARQILRAGDP
jgi:hypothetical protein